MSNYTGYCLKHWKRQLRWGNPLVAHHPMLPFKDRLALASKIVDLHWQAQSNEAAQLQQAIVWCAQFKYVDVRVGKWGNPIRKRSQLKMERVLRELRPRSSPKRLAVALVEFVLWNREPHSAHVDSVVERSVLADRVIGTMQTTAKSYKQRLQELRLLKDILGQHFMEHVVPFAAALVVAFENSRPALDAAVARKRRGRSKRAEYMRRYRAAARARGLTAKEVRAGRTKLAPADWHTKDASEGGVSASPPGR